ncbi:MAG: hypothetical protein IKL03_07795, partial [Bacteroidaceae bacterium]|nr:hypothetical protein [Bacteroidaceae bacterium]
LNIYKDIIHPLHLYPYCKLNKRFINAHPMGKVRHNTRPHASPTLTLPLTKRSHTPRIPSASASRSAARYFPAITHFLPRGIPRRGEGVDKTLRALLS